MVEVFEPALQDERIRSSTLVAELSGGLRALQASGLLAPELSAEAQRRLVAAHQHALCEPPEVLRAGSVAAKPTNLLRHVFAPLTPLVDFNGVTLVLASVELWTRSVRLRIAGLNNATSDRLDDEHRTAFEGWGAKVREAQARGSRMPDDPPREPGARLLDMDLTLTDDLDTEYRGTVSSAGASNTEWRLEVAYEPGVPVGASHLVLTAGGTYESLAHEIELELPRP